ncbi:MAG: hypothetical protein IJW30_02575 [Clostridia bacterium]|nr:hypothetical protein [Clostridia bacterium]
MAGVIIAGIFTVAWLIWIVVGSRLSERSQKKRSAKMIEKEFRKVLQPRTDFFVPLYERLDYLKKYGSHFHIDAMIYALYKVRLCAIMEIENRELPDSEIEGIISYYDLLMCCSLEEWMEKHAPAFKNPMEIIESRINAYDRVMIESDLPQSLTMSCLTATFCRFVKNGWVKNKDGKNSRIPTNAFDLQQVTWADKNPHQEITEEIEFVVIHHASLKLPNFIDSFCEGEKVYYD